MPTYYYECKDCDSTISHLIPLNETSKTPKCLDCNKEMTRVYSVPNIAFRGSGWGSGK